MEEKNKSTLRQALDQLPQYQPPDSLWGNIESDLERPQPLPLDRLPGYTPPPQVWNHLNEALDQNNQRRLRIRRLRIVGLAAGFLLAIGLFAWFEARQGPTITVAYSQEPASEVVLTKDWDADEQSFDQITVDPWELDRGSEFADLQFELEELSQAKEEVKAMLVAYGGDPQLVRQLSNIERERSAVYRQIIANDLAE